MPKIHPQRKVDTGFTSSHIAKKELHMRVATLLVVALCFSVPARAAGLNDWACKPTRQHPRPVVLVHGRGGDVNGFGTLVGALSNAGYCVFGTNYGQVGGSGPNGMDHLTVSALEIRDFVQKVLAATGSPRVDVIGHSAGTGVLDNFILQRGGASQITRLVSFGGLHHPYAHVGVSGVADSDLFLPNLILAARLVNPNVTAQEVITQAIATYAGAGGSLAGIDVTTAESNFASDLFDPVYWTSLQGSLSEPPEVFVKPATTGRTFKTHDSAPGLCYTNIVGVVDVLAGATAGFQDAAPNVENFLLFTTSDHSQILDDPIAVGKALAALGAPCAAALPHDQNVPTPAIGCSYTSTPVGAPWGVVLLLVGSYLRASRTRLNGVSVARRKRLKPASSNTARRRASPACAPSPRPTSCESELGVQMKVDAA
jgi:pimeloyl-ACP methyl ester carboxylesterase